MEVKFPIYLNRRVFVMVIRETSKQKDKQMERNGDVIENLEANVASNQLNKAQLHIPTNYKVCF